MGGGKHGITRGMLLKLLRRYAEDDTGCHLKKPDDIILVFDSRGPRSIEHHQRVQAWYCGKGLIADEVIGDLVDEMDVGDLESTVVVTSDLELSARVCRRGVRVLKSDSFYQIINPGAPPTNE
mmetsp:Transcript_11288/g.21661  ORF Transcript_11288/g.21661 Transcript_11288/m.21661 type:complete len:123 (-) Transcript_11288:361-729(-)|eukprot:CAMPEP_0170199036 /NCGR_PEP_ID=MMETSP0040_2-20121228/69118_1 /TAXON_ID=641309 /ORGANISM="Lotharella oceanica, Strain CCMP622" /LENGTH=122 /DNA_ID=CAMNT_0010449117 /DNA_START=606 /DNA_END=974 /DNA_ORIENTATION=-